MIMRNMSMFKRSFKTVLSVIFIVIMMLVVSCEGSNKNNEAPPLAGEDNNPVIGEDYNTDETIPEKLVGKKSYSGSNFEISEDGKLYVSGDNSYGQLGLGHTNYVSTPTPVSLPGDSIKEVTIPFDGRSVSVYAVSNNGKLYSWGNNMFGQLGVGSSDNISIPTLVSLEEKINSVTDIRFMNTTVIDIKYTSSAVQSMFVLGENGGIYSWGTNQMGQLGINSRDNITSPEKVVFPAGVTKFSNFKIDYISAYAVGNDGNLYSWGRNYYGNLGIGSIDYVNLPTKVKLPDDIKVIDYKIGSDFSVFVLGSDKQIYSFGNNGNGHYIGLLGIGSIEHLVAPIKVAISPTYEVITTPIKVTLPEGVEVNDYFVGDNSSVFVNGSDGKMYAWGDNRGCQLGVAPNNVNDIEKSCFDSSTVDSPKQLIIPEATKKLKIIKVHKYTQNYMFALGDSGELYAWGSNANGLLGVNSTSAVVINPTKVAMPDGVKLKKVWLDSYNGLNSYSVIFITGSDDKLYAWGKNTNGELGIDSTEQIIAKPTEVATPDRVIVQSIKIFVIGSHLYSPALYAYGSDGNIYSWGKNINGILGIGSDADNSTKPQRVLLNDCVSGINSFTTNMFENSNGIGHMPYIFINCDNGGIYSWGNNDDGLLGIGSTEEYVNKPTALVMPEGVSKLSIINYLWYSSIMSAIGNNGKKYRWGGGVLVPTEVTE